MVTAETAVAVPAVVLVLALALSGLSLGVDAVRCQDAARVVVRELARGESLERATRDAARTMQRGAEIGTSTSGGLVTVTVFSRPPAPLRAIGLARGAECSSTARVEEVIE